MTIIQKNITNPKVLGIDPTEVNHTEGKYTTFYVTVDAVEGEYMLECSISYNGFNEVEIIGGHMIDDACDIHQLSKEIKEELVYELNNRIAVTTED